MTQNDYEQLGKDWLDGKAGVLEEFNGIKLNPKQIEYINSKKRSVLFSGGMRAGKTYAFIIKFILLSQYFPNSQFLIGRKTQGNAEDTFMKDFMELCPAGIYVHQKGYHKIKFGNGSEAEFWGLDALQSGASSDIKKAEQKLKSHTFHFILTDQLEEIEMKVFDALQTRLSGKSCPHSEENFDIVRDKEGSISYQRCRTCGKYTFNQYLATTNPANFWGYDYFKVNPRPNTQLVEISTIENKMNLPSQFIENELLKPEAYKERFLYGKWDDKTMVEGGVFYEEWILNQRALQKPPIRVVGGIRIFEEPAKEEYQIGIDPSLGVSDPCAIICISKKSGKVVATYKAYVPTNVIVEKAVQIALMYSLLDKPLMVPESTGVGQALIEGLRPVYEKIYIRELSGGTMEKTIQKLGFYTTFASKNLLIENMKELMQKGFPKFQDEHLVNEMNKFIYTDEAQQQGAGAQKGYHDDMCFVAGTKILTNKGQRNIENIEIGDLVMTRGGYRKVIEIGNHLDNIFKSSIHNLIGTPNHPIITTNGEIRLDSLKVSDILYIWNEKQFCIEEKSIIDILTQKDDNYGSTFGDTINGKNPRLRFIVKYGLITLVKFLRECLFITKTIILSIITQTILNVLRFWNISENTLHQKDENKLLTMLKDYIIFTENHKKQIVYNVEKNLYLLVKEEQNFVQIYVGNAIGEKQEKQLVYNLKVEDYHEYFANGVLVHNCMSAMLAYWKVPFVYQEENKTKEKMQTQFRQNKQMAYLNSNK